MDADDADEMSLVSVYANVPVRAQLGAGSFVRFNLFAVTSGEYQHLASAVAPAGTTGELIVASGHLVDGYHVFCQGTFPQQDVKIALVCKPCAGRPYVAVRPDLLALAFAPAEIGASGICQPPFVPWGQENGAPGTFEVTGSGDQVFPDGARLKRWTAQGTGGGGTIRIDSPFGAGVAFNVPASAVVVGEPLQSVANIHFTNLAFGVFEFVD